MHDKSATLAAAVEAARNLNEPGEHNVEYVRGQAELICDTFGISTDLKDGIIAVIAREVEPLSAWLATLGRD